jgi:hypothetical protein
VRLRPSWIARKAGPAAPAFVRAASVPVTGPETSAPDEKRKLALTGQRFCNALGAAGRTKALWDSPLATKCSYLQSEVRLFFVGFNGQWWVQAAVAQ